MVIHGYIYISISNIMSVCTSVGVGRRGRSCPPLEFHRVNSYKDSTSFAAPGGLEGTRARAGAF